MTLMTLNTLINRNLMLKTSSAGRCAENHFKRDYTKLREKLTTEKRLFNNIKLT